MPKKGYRNRNSQEKRYQPSAYVPQSPTFGDKSIYPWMSLQQRDERLGTLLQKEKETQDRLDEYEAQATTNQNNMDRNEKYQRVLENEKLNQGIFSQGLSIFSFGELPKIENEIRKLQFEHAKYERIEQKLREQIRAQIEIQEEITRSKNDIKRMLLDSGRDSTDGHRLSIINSNYVKIYKFIESHVNNFKFSGVPSNYALMHALANEIQRQYVEQNDEEFDFYKKPIDFDMLNNAFIAMPIFQSGNIGKAFLEQAKQAEQAKQREKAELSRQQQDAYNKVISSRPPLSLVLPGVYKANPNEKRKRDEVEVEVEVEVEDEDENKSKSRRKTKTSDGGRRARRSRSRRKSKK